MENSVQKIEVETEYLVDGEKPDRHEFIDVRVPSCIAIACCDDLDIFLLKDQGITLATHLMIALKEKRDDIDIDAHITAKPVACII